MNDTDTIQVNIRHVDPAVWQRLRIEGILRGNVPIGHLVSEAVSEWLANHGTKEPK